MVVSSARDKALAVVLLVAAVVAGDTRVAGSGGAGQASLGG